MSILLEQRRRTHRAQVNPLDVCTVVSIFPKEINEVKHTIQPGRFKIAVGTTENPAVLVVGSSSWWREIDEEQPLLEIPNSSIQVAESICNDYLNGLLACNLGRAQPGVYFIPGEHTVETVKSNNRIRPNNPNDTTTFKQLLDKYNGFQKAWYAELIKLADGLWARTNGNPLVISDDMRLAAKELGSTNKDWMTDFEAVDMIRCAACGAFRNPKYPICGSCHNVIDKELAAKLKLDIK